MALGTPLDFRYFQSAALFIECEPCPIFWMFRVLTCIKEGRCFVVVSDVYSGDVLIFMPGVGVLVLWFLGGHMGCPINTYSISVNTPKLLALIGRYSARCFCIKVFDTQILLILFTIDEIKSVSLNHNDTLLI